VVVRLQVGAADFIADRRHWLTVLSTSKCWQYAECSQLGPFAKAGKPILNVEYENLPQSTTCKQALAFPMATMHTDVNLDGKLRWRAGGRGASLNEDF
jgi:Glycoside-hydrolase family GH114